MIDTQISWILLVIILIPFSALGVMFYRYNVYPEEIVWTKEDIEEYEKKKYNIEGK